jgi:hypothetical protein
LVPRFFHQYKGERRGGAGHIIGRTTSRAPSASSNSLKPEAEFTNRGKVGVGGANTVPVTRDEMREGGMGRPGVFHSENGAPLGFGRDL